MSSLPDISEFKYEIHATTADGSFCCGGARGDGYCSIWSVLIGWSLLTRSDLIRNRELLDIDIQPTNMEQLRTILIRCCQILSQPDIMSTIKIVEPWFTVQDWEIGVLKSQLELSSDKLQTIQGEAIFTILGFLFGIYIVILDKPTQKIYGFGDPNNDTVKITTNGAHYYPVSNTGDINNFINHTWWRQQWVGHPISELLIPIIKY